MFFFVWYQRLKTGLIPSFYDFSDHNLYYIALRIIPVLNIDCPTLNWRRSKFKMMKHPHWHVPLIGTEERTGHLWHLPFYVFILATRCYLSRQRVNCWSAARVVAGDFHTANQAAGDRRRVRCDTPTCDAVPRRSNETNAFWNRSITCYS